jgi:TnpA family transposase
MIKYATALRLGTAETEAILKRFTRKTSNIPLTWLLPELGKAIKTIFSLSVPTLGSAAARNPRRRQHHRDLERGQQLHPLR